MGEVIHILELIFSFTLWWLRRPKYPEVDMRISPRTFLLLIITLSARWRFSVTSWLRSEAHNKAVGGVEDSMHLYGLAVDVVMDPDERRDPFLRACRRLGLLAIDEGDHIHIQVI